MPEYLPLDLVPDADNSPGHPRQAVGIVHALSYDFITQVASADKLLPYFAGNHSPKESAYSFSDINDFPILILKLFFAFFKCAFLHCNA